VSGARVEFGDKASIARAKKGGLSKDLYSYGVEGLRAWEEQQRTLFKSQQEADEALMRAMAAAREALPPVEVTRFKRRKRARVNTIAPSDYSGEFRVLYHAIDTYLVNLVQGEVREDFMTLLPMAQEEARAAGGVALAPLPPFLGENLSIKDHGGGTFRFLCSNADVTVKIRKPERAPSLAAAQVQLSAACLHRLGYVAALRALAAWVKEWCPAAKLQPSRVDICADTQGWAPTFEDITRRAFVCPTPRSHLICEGTAINYLRWGTGGREGSRSGAAPIQLVIYDKTEEIRVSDKGWFVPLWAQSDRYDAEESVYRIEARFTREYLKERRIETQAQLLEALPALWHEALEWCRYCEPPADGGDSNRSRLPVRKEWRVLRSVSWHDAAEVPLERIDQCRPKLERTLAAIGGHLVTLQALFRHSMVPDLPTIAELAVPALQARWDSRGEDFRSKVKDRAQRLGGVGMI
jgi:hypothetical protein